MKKLERKEKKLVSTMASYPARVLFVWAAIMMLAIVVHGQPGAPTYTLEPGVPSPQVYMVAHTNPPKGTYFAVNMTRDPPVASFMLIVSLDTTRSSVLTFWSTTRQQPNYNDHDGTTLSFKEQTNGYRFSVVNNPVMHGMYYFGVFVAFDSPAAALFSAMVTFYNGSQFAPSNNGNFSLSSSILQVSSSKEVPSITASWTGLSKYRNYTFYKFPSGCGVNPLMSNLEHVVSQGTPFISVGLEDPTSETVTATLTGFEDDVAVFCVNLVAMSENGVPETVWLAQTIYYPHPRDGIQPVAVDSKKWSAYVWTAVIFTSILFVGAPIGIIIHRIWISRRRAQKRRETLLNGPGWVD